MTEDMQQDVVDICSVAFKQFTVEKDIAAHIKKVRRETLSCSHAQECDRKYGGTWHAVVGRSFGSFVTHGALQPTRGGSDVEQKPSTSCTPILARWHCCCSDLASFQYLYFISLGTTSNDAQVQGGASRCAREEGRLVEDSASGLSVARCLASCRLQT